MFPIPFHSVLAIAVANEEVPKLLLSVTKQPAHVVSIQPETHSTFMPKQKASINTYLLRRQSATDEATGCLAQSGHGKLILTGRKYP